MVDRHQYDTLLSLSSPDALRHVLRSQDESLRPVLDILEFSLYDQPVSDLSHSHVDFPDHLRSVDDLEYSTAINSYRS